MPVTYTVWELPEPPPLHTEDSFHAIGRPAYENGGSEEHWYAWWLMLCAVLRPFGAPATLYERCSFRRKVREDAFALLRMMEAALRCILMIMAGEDTRPLEPYLPRKTRGPAKGETKTGAARRQWRGLPPEKLPIHFALYPALETAPASAKKPAAPRPRLELPPELTLPPLDRQDKLARPFMIAEFKRQARENKRVPVYSLVARLEAIIRVYKDPKPYVMRLRQRIAAEQGRLARAICTRILAHPPRVRRVKGSILDTVYDDARKVAHGLMSGRSPPIA